MMGPLVYAFKDNGKEILLIFYGYDDALRLVNKCRKYDPATKTYSYLPARVW